MGWTSQNHLGEFTELEQLLALCEKYKVKSCKLEGIDIEFHQPVIIHKGNLDSLPTEKMPSDKEMLFRSTSFQPPDEPGSEK